MDLQPDTARCCLWDWAVGQNDAPKAEVHGATSRAFAEILEGEYHKESSLQDRRRC